MSELAKGILSGISRSLIWDQVKNKHDRKTNATKLSLDHRQLSKLKELHSCKK